MTSLVIGPASDRVGEIQYSISRTGCLLAIGIAIGIGYDTSLDWIWLDWDRCDRMEGAFSRTERDLTLCLLNSMTIEHHHAMTGGSLAVYISSVNTNMMYNFSFPLSLFFSLSLSHTHTNTYTYKHYLSHHKIIVSGIVEVSL
jgi:hypothetical protein